MRRKTKTKNEREERLASQGGLVFVGQGRKSRRETRPTCASLAGALIPSRCAAGRWGRGRGYKGRALSQNHRTRIFLRTCSNRPSGRIFSFLFSLGAGVTPAQGCVKPTVGFTFNC